MVNTFKHIAYRCDKCDLCKTRTKIVLGSGDPNAKIMILGEGPGAAEDLEGVPFVGRSGALLDQALTEAGLLRSEVFITNIVKCRPPGNRNPTPQEMDACYDYLVQQVQEVQPVLVVTLGKVSAEYVLQRPVKITKECGAFAYPTGISKLTDQLFLTVLHPAYVLRNRSSVVEHAFFQAIHVAKEVADGCSDVKTRKRSGG